MRRKKTKFRIGTKEKLIYDEKLEISICAVSSYNKKCFICFGKCEKNETMAEQAKLRLVSRNFAVELEEEGKRRRQV